MRWRDERGMALVFVLYLLITLGVIAAEVARSARAEAAMVAGMRARSVGRYAAESGIAAGMVRIHQLLDSASSMPERIALFRRANEALTDAGEAALGSGRFQVSVVNLNARLDLNHTAEGTLRDFFRQFTSRHRADAAVAALKKDPIRRVGELIRLPGMDQALAFAVAPYVTVWSDGLVDINEAAESVLAVLPGVGRAAARSLVDRRQAGEVFMSSDVAQPPRTSSSEDGTPEAPSTPAHIPQAITFPTRLLLVSRGWQDGHPLTHEIQAAYMILGHRLVLQAWWERDL